jgi:hypothetical protein
MPRRAAGAILCTVEDAGISRRAEVGGWDGVSLGCVETCCECGGGGWESSYQGGISWRGPADIPVAAALRTRRCARLALALQPLLGGECCGRQRHNDGHLNDRVKRK